MAGNEGRAADSKNDKILPVITIKSIFFPATSIKINKSAGKFSMPKNVSDKTKYFALMNDAEPEIGPGLLRKTGVVCSLERNSDGYFLTGESRAEVIEIWRDEKNVLLAKINELEDVPSAGGLTEAEMPMMFGCIESIRRFLKKWQEKIPKNESELYKNITEQIVKIEAGRREIRIAYSLPWHILVNFPYFFSLSFKEKMLKTNKVIDRLLSVAEKLQQEISIFTYSESFSDVNADVPIELENGER
ncbi:MAG: hypothetical protein HYT65_02010 [Candidatus Yanofskybacteria bacterium]|nr:hypothetical protein [Candidatus Yanofskybacteria bacterium]